MTGLHPIFWTKAAAGGSTIVGSATLATGLQNYYKADSSSSFLDEVGSNDGTRNGVTFTASGKINGAYSGDGINDNVALSTLFSSNSEISVSMWVKLTAITATHSLFESQNVNDRIILFVRSDGQLDGIAGGASEFALPNTGGTTLVTGVLYHLVLTFDAATGLNVHVNGNATPDKSATGTATAITGGSAPALFSREGGAADFVNGIQDEIGIWTKKLSNAEIAELYNSGAGLPYN